VDIEAAADAIEDLVEQNVAKALAPRRSEGVTPDSSILYVPR